MVIFRASCWRSFCLPRYRYLHLPVFVTADLTSELRLPTVIVLTNALLML
jgi:hypothetical protein